MLSTSIGITSFFLFSYCRTRWPLLFAPRTKLKGTMDRPHCLLRSSPSSRPGFSPSEAHAHQAFFGWILPTIRTSEFTVLQIVGLDAAVVCTIYSRVVFGRFKRVCSFSISSRCHFICFLCVPSLLSPFSCPLIGR